MERRRTYWAGVTALALVAACAGAALATPAASARTSGRPNIVVVLTDDQRWDTLSAMPTVEQKLVARLPNDRDGFARSGLHDRPRRQVPEPLRGRHPRRALRPARLGPLDGAPRQDGVQRLPACRSGTRAALRPRPLRLLDGRARAQGGLLRGTCAGAVFPRVHAVWPARPGNPTAALQERLPAVLLEDAAELRRARPVGQACLHPQARPSEPEAARAGGALPPPAARGGPRRRRCRQRAREDARGPAHAQDDDDRLRLRQRRLLG